MIDSRLATTAALILLVAGPSIAAQGGFQHREYRLASGVATVLVVSPMRMDARRPRPAEVAAVEEKTRETNRGRVPPVTTVNVV